MPETKPVLLCVYLVYPVTHITSLANKALPFVPMNKGTITISTETTMRIHKGTFKIRTRENDQPVWTNYDGSYGNDYPFYVHRTDTEKSWTLSHMSTGYMIKSHLSLKQARQLSKALKEWPLFLMPTAETLQHQKSLLPTHKQEQLNTIIHNIGETDE